MEREVGVVEEVVVEEEVEEVGVAPSRAPMYVGDP